MHACFPKHEEEEREDERIDPPVALDSHGEVVQLHVYTIVVADQLLEQFHVGLVHETTNENQTPTIGSR